MALQSLSDDILQLEDGRYAAMLANQPDELAPFLDDDVVYIHSSAVKDGKHAYLRSIADGQLVYKAFRRQYDGMVQLGPDAVLLSGRIGIDIVLRGKPVTLDNLFTLVWKRSADGDWRLASWQSTPIPVAS